MPAVQPGSLVLVTGATGFIAAHTCKLLLDAGYPVRGTVRSEAKGQYLKDLFGSSAKFETVIVEDIEQENAFDEAVKGVDGVLHMASPFHLKADDPKEMIGPAVGGTVGILKSLKKNNPDAKRVVITSSVAAIADSTRPVPTRFTEADWNESSPKVCEEKGKDAPGGDKYRASKTLAEKAFWKFLKEEDVKFDGATINPPMVYGPIIHQVDKPESLNTSVAAFYDWLVSEKKESDIPDVAPFNSVDVRDVALAHVRALTMEEASGKRFLTSAGPSSPNDFCLAIHQHFPKNASKIPAGDASKVDKINKASNVHDGSHTARVLDIKYHDLDTTLKDMGQCLIDKFNL